jgi:hypothetical protein
MDAYLRRDVPANSERCSRAAADDNGLGVLAKRCLDLVQGAADRDVEALVFEHLTQHPQQYWIVFQEQDAGARHTDLPCVHGNRQPSSVKRG